MDNGATHHITLDLYNLFLHKPCSGENDVVIGYGSTIPKQQADFSNLSTYTHPLVLDNVLYVPHINKNMIYVYKICNFFIQKNIYATLMVFMNFFSSIFQVKDLRIESGCSAAELKTNCMSGLLPTPQANVSSTYPTSKESLSSWQSRLGHPYSSILNNIF